MAAGATVFFGLWLQKALQTAAANPSGFHLADALARFVELERPGPVLELGAGTGSLTRGLVRAGCPLERIIAVEQEPSFAAVLRRNCPGATVIERNAARIGQYLAGHVERLSTVVGFYSLYACAHALVPKGCKNCVEDISENDDPLRSWAAARCSRLPWRPPSCCCTRDEESESADDLRRANWRMPPLRELPPMRMTPLTRIWMVVLRGYLVVAGGLVLVRIIEMATAEHAETRCRHRSRQMAKTSHDIHRTATS